MSIDDSRGNIRTTGRKTKLWALSGGVIFLLLVALWCGSRLFATPEDAVHEYVRQTKHWIRSDYVIKFVGTKESLLVYDVLHAEDAKSPVMGGGKSIQLYFDRSTRMIVKEMFFQ